MSVNYKNLLVVHVIGYFATLWNDLIDFNCFTVIMLYCVGHTVALLPHSKKGLGSIPGRATRVLSVWSLHVLPVSTWVSKDMQLGRLAC